MRKNYIIFTDLDGTLLDFNNYSYQKAKEALKIIKEKNIPLIICTSKTRAEIELYQKRLNNRHPFISENGGAIYIPPNYFPDSLEMKLKTKDGYKVIELGIRYYELKKGLKEIEKKVGVKLVGFSQISPKEISQLTNLSKDSAKLAKKREYSEPFYPIEDEAEFIYKLKKEASLLNLGITRGGRFYHLIGGNDKGRAVQILTNIYRSFNKQIKTVGIGDSLNDLPMLKVVDIPILVKKPGGEYDKRVQGANLIYSSGVGPAGWNEAVLNLLKQNKGGDV